ncbi:hypothetical protein [Streptomyces californicus]|uniref:hypothetical protein n=1 Tax=Streptomyces californicus TaxID=67351 RepID=UPI0033F0148E
MGSAGLLAGLAAVVVGRLVQGDEPAVFPCCGLERGIGLLPCLGGAGVLALLLLVVGTNAVRDADTVLRQHLLVGRHFRLGRLEAGLGLGGVLLQAGAAGVPQPEDPLLVLSPPRKVEAIVCWRRARTVL